MQESTSEMTGAVAPTIRKGLWQEKRVFFLTPQTLEQDLITGEQFPIAIIFLPAFCYYFQDSDLSPLQCLPGPSGGTVLMDYDTCLQIGVKPLGRITSSSAPFEQADSLKSPSDLERLKLRTTRFCALALLQILQMNFEICEAFLSRPPR